MKITLPNILEVHNDFAGWDDDLDPDYGRGKMEGNYHLINFVYKIVSFLIPLLYFTDLAEKYALCHPLKSLKVVKLTKQSKCN